MSEPLNFTVRKYHGCEVYAEESFVGPERSPPLRRVGDMTEGRRVVTAALTGMCSAVVKLDEQGRLYLKSGGSRGSLEYAQDDRGCWVATGWFNEEAIKRVNFTKE